MSNNIVSDALYSSQQALLLACLVDVMIPASEVHGVPGAVDDLILGPVQLMLAPHTASVSHFLDHLDRAGFATMDEAAQLALVNAGFSEHQEAFTAIAQALAHCYYRDPRVMRSLRVPARPAYPEGHSLEQGDWSLLDPVRAKQKLYRD